MLPPIYIIDIFSAVLRHIEHCDLGKNIDSQMTIFKLANEILKSNNT